MKRLGHFAAWFLCLLEVLHTPALALQVLQPRRILADSHNVTLECAYDTTGDGPFEQFGIIIYKGEPTNDTEVCAMFFNNSANHFKTATAPNCQAQIQNGSVSVTLSGLNTSHSDLYICHMAKIHPPPYIEGKGDGTCIFIAPEMPEAKPCPEFTQSFMIVLVIAALFMFSSIFISCIHWPLGTTACILRMKEAVDMKCELIHNYDEPATATWTGQRWETGPRQEVAKEPRRTEQ
ncbi:cytotoxic T-lymphocyte protein 4-like isoform X1 [Hemiscyllium ocellatum]|uniref:cytotoxic T-lymphocyte protein 4-like isoform X1 n=1 Tax=Hemiscyllium ocellatum TaxID=170820 RepID=UPI0029664A64|nr:cytotoxic T-lymphocyte protein 4-like isoform X1 [Hemiscyllium ocellatum]